MRKVKRWRYYCDHCKKSGGSVSHMQRHERGCTANPNRVCGVCAHLEFSAAPLDELIALVKQIGAPEHSEHSEQDWILLDTDAFAQLREKADNCPCCILAALRQTGASYADHFDFKKELASAWSEHNAMEAADRASYQSACYS